MSDLQRKQFWDFIKTKRIYEKDEPFTHTRIGRRTNGGKYNFVDGVEHQKFMKYYTNIIQVVDLNFSEAQKEVGPLMLDVDLKNKEETRQYTLLDVTRIVQQMNKVIYQLVNLESRNITVYICEKEKPVYDGKAKLYKDGFHICYIIPLSKKQRMEIYQAMKRFISFEKLKHENNINTVFDDSTIIRNNWVMYGSRKENGLVYRLTHVFDYQMNELPLLEFDELVYLMSIRQFDKDDCLSFRELIVSHPEIKPIQHIQELVEKSKVDTKEKVVFDTEMDVIKMFFDKCYNSDRYTKYDSWYRVGMALKNKYGNKGFELFKYFSYKSPVHDNDIQLKEKYDSFRIMKDSISLGTIYNYAKKDNKDEFIRIMTTYSIFKDFMITATDVARYIKLLRPNDFVWKNRVLYCFNGTQWTQNDLTIRNFISEELYFFLKDILITCHWNIKNTEFNHMKKSLELLKNKKFKEDVIATTEEYLTNDDIEFDNKYYLFGFKNKVYDLREGQFRDYQHDDYITLTTRYDWIDPLEEEITTLKKIVRTIMPDKKERELYLEILSTALEGRCLEKFVIFNGKGRNGKGLIDDLCAVAFGSDYYLPGNNAILFERNRTGSNPEKNNIHKKRLIIFREPPDSGKFENAVVKELTGGGSFSARGHHESETTKALHLTMIVECNKKPLFAEEPQRAEVERLIDLYFGSTFTDDPKEVDESNRIYLGKKEYKNEDFQEKHKRAMLYLLMKAYKKYQEREYHFDIPQSVRNRANEYLEMSSKLTTWINDNYVKTDNRKDVVKLQDVYNKFKCSSYFENLTKADKRSYNYKYFIKQISESIFFTKYYVERTKINGIFYYNILTNYKEIIQNDEVIIV